MTRLMRFRFIIFIICLGLQGCVKHIYEAEPVNYTDVFSEINSWTIENAKLNQFLNENGLGTELLSSNQFSIKRLYLTSLFYDPEMRVAYKKWKQAKIVLGNSNYRINPKISLPLEHHSDNTDTSNLWSIGAVLSFIYERKGKREARQAKAEVNLLNATLKIKQLALHQYGIFEERYHAYVIKQAKIVEIRNEINVLKELLALLQKQHELGGVSQFELDSTSLALQQGLFQLSLEENKLQELMDQLLAMTHLTYAELDDIEIISKSPILFANSEYQDSEYFSISFFDLQRLMLESHIDMAIKLNRYALSEADLRLKIEQQYPDIVLSPGYIFEQSDNIWALGTSWVLPLFEKTKQNLNILTALEERRIKQQEITVLQKTLLNSLYQRYRSISRHKESIKVSDEIIESIEQRSNEIKIQIKAGGIGSAALLRNRKEFYKAKQEQLTIYSEAITALLEMEHLLQNSHSDINANNIVTAWLKYIEENSNNESTN